MPSTPGVLNFPAALDDVVALIVAGNKNATTLTAGVLVGDVTLTVASTTGFPTSGTISIDNEIISYTGTTSTTFTGCTRGIDGTSAATHSSSTQVYGFLAAIHHNILASAIIAAETKLGITSSTPTVGKYLRGSTTAGTSLWSLLVASDINTAFASADFLPGQNIGVGVATALAQVHVSGAGQATAAPSVSTIGGGSIIAMDSGGSAGDGGLILVGAGSTQPFAGIKGYYTDGSNHGAGHLIFLTKNLSTDTVLAERMRIQSNGLVGIGMIPGGSYNVEIAGSLHTTGTVQFDGFFTANGTMSQGGSISGQIGFFQQGTLTGGGTLYGFYQGQVLKPSASGGSAIFQQLGGSVDTSVAGGTVTQAFGVLINAITKTGANAITTAFGIFINAPTAGTSNIALYVSGTATVTGAMSKGSGTFQIDHPLDSANTDLLYGFTESPRYDLLHRGAETTVRLVRGKAVVNIDDASHMRRGTFSALTRESEAEVFLQGSDFPRCIASPIVNGQFTITCEDNTSAQLVSWLVMAERNDAYVHSTIDPMTKQGRLMVEMPKLPPDVPGVLQNGRVGYERHPTAFGKPDRIILPARGQNGPQVV